MFGSCIKHRSPVSRRTTIYHFVPQFTHSIYESAHFCKQKTTKMGPILPQKGPFQAKTPTYTPVRSVFEGQEINLKTTWSWIGYNFSHG